MAVRLLVIECGNEARRGRVLRTSMELRTGAKRRSAISTGSIDIDRTPGVYRQPESRAYSYTRAAQCLYLSKVDQRSYVAEGEGTVPALPWRRAGAQTAPSLSSLARRQLYSVPLAVGPPLPQNGSPSNAGG